MRKRSQHNTKRHSRGYGLVVVLGIAAVLTVFTATISTQAAFNLNSIERQGQTDSAYYGAYTGIQLTMSMLHNPPDMDGDGVMDNWLETDRGVFIVTNSGQVGARLYHNFEGFGGATSAPGAPPEDLPPDGTIVPLDHFYIMSVCDTPSGISADATTMGATVAPDFPVLTQAAFGNASVDIQGSTDWWDSRGLGPGVAATSLVVPLGGGDPMDSDLPAASVATNSPDAASVMIGSTARINGHVVLGESATSSAVAGVSGTLSPAIPVSPTPPSVYAVTPATMLATSATPGASMSATSTTTPGAPTATPPGDGANPANHGNVNGFLSKMTQPKTLPTIEENPLDAVPLSSGNMTVSGTLDLTEGVTYTVPGNFAVSSSAVINVVDGPDADSEVNDARILVNGNITIAGGASVNDSQPPRRLKLYSIQDDANFVMSGNSEAYALVAGKKLHVHIADDSQLWGAVLGETVILDQNATIHYDNSLRDPNLVADLYGYFLLGVATTPGAVVPPTTLAALPPGTAVPATPPPAPAPGTTTCGGCGGCGSAMMAVK